MILKCLDIDGYIRCLKAAMQVANLLLLLHDWYSRLKNGPWLKTLVYTSSPRGTPWVYGRPKLMKNNTFETLVPGWRVVGQSLLGQSCFRAEVGTRPKYSLGWIILRAEVCFGPKYAPGQSEFGAKAISGPNWVWALPNDCLITVKDLLWLTDQETTQNDYKTTRWHNNNNKLPYEAAVLPAV